VIVVAPEREWKKRNRNMPLAEVTQFPTVVPSKCVEAEQPRTNEIKRRDSNEEETPRTILSNMLLVGAQKAGSTAIANSLFDNGVCHPQVFEGEPEYFGKEVPFFNQKHRDE
jgi:hypothetical protein